MKFLSNVISKKMPKMQIMAVRTIDSVLQYAITFVYQKKSWEVSVYTKNSEVYGNFFTNVSTAQLEYFDISESIRERHFEQFKKAIYDARGKQIQSR